MDRINVMIAKILKELKNREGEDAMLEEGDNLVGVANDGILILEMEGGNIKVNVILGEPMVIDHDFNLLEGDDAE